MYLSLNWLKDFVKISKKTSSETLAHFLTMHTVEVEGWKEQSRIFDKVVVAKVLSVEPHPNADRLRLVSVDIKKEILSIVCGASNVAVGQRVPVALIGASLPNGLVIKESEIRGQKSFGMICAEDELGLGQNHEGIMILAEHAKVGQSFADYLGLNDIILEIDNKSLSNRGDLWGHYGMAREISTLLKTPLRPYLQADESIFIPSGKDSVAVKVEDKKICSRYIAVKIDKVEAVESPNWLKERLAAVGIRPINAIVDITNYVMIESGQPLHAFDASGIKKIVVRLSKEGESLETLDGKERLLPEETILITDGDEALAIAGIMGGTKSAISEKTNSIILEAATFDAVYVRKSSQKLNLRTDASMRFEKTLDPNLPLLAWKRAWQLIKEIIPTAELAGDPSDIINFKMEIEPITVDFSWLKKKLGRDISRKDAINILERLGFTVSLEKNILLVSTPSWRAVKDVAIKEDILEEVARIIGYDNIISSSPTIYLSLLPENEELLLERKIQDVLSGAGALHEVYNYSFLSESSLVKLNFDTSRHLQLVNPISEQHVFLRQSLLVGLLQNARSNQFNYQDFGLFEIGRVFLPLPGEYNKDDNGELLPYQSKRLGMLVAGFDNVEIFDRAKGLLSLLFSSLWPQASVEFTVLENLPAWSQDGRAASVRCADKDLGFVGLLDDKLSAAFGLKIKTAFIELNFPEILALNSLMPARQYQETSKYPTIIRDISFVVNEKILYNDFWRALSSFNYLLKRVELFDIYQGGALGDNSKSWAFHLVYQAADRTLTAEEIDLIQLDLIQMVHDRFDAQIRDF